MRIQTNHVFPPIPTRTMDWSAIDADTYDGEGCPIGWGRTEAEAVADLKEQFEDAAESGTQDKETTGE